MTLRNLKSSLAVLLSCSVCIMQCACSHHDRKTDTGENDMLLSLNDTLTAITKEYPGEIGIALITDSGDTLTINNEAKYPLMSVFKLHQAIALSRDFERKGFSLDTTVTIRRTELNPDTWSPMLKDFPSGDISITIRDLLRYTLTQSDNNASNWMFAHCQPVAAADSCIATIIPRESFRLSFTEAEMWEDHSLAYQNRTSPLGAAILIDHLFTDSITGVENANFIRTTLAECKTGTDRIAAPFQGMKGATVAHKTGSGFRSPEGILSAHNDLAYITLPDGDHYTLAVFVKDFRGTETEAAQAIARISGMILSHMVSSSTSKTRSGIEQNDLGARNEE